jgi:UDP-glucose 4-epimerase
MITAWRTALVTGSTGFIGRHLVRHLEGIGIDVTCLQRTAPQGQTSSNVLLLSAFEPRAIEAALTARSFDVIFHLAAYGVSPSDRDDHLMQTVNVDSTATLARIAAGWSAKAMIIAGSGSEYDFTGVTQPVSETHALQTKSTYGASKTAGGKRARDVAADSEMSVVVARIFNVYGSGEAAHRLLPSLLSGLDGKGRIPLSEGIQQRDFLHVSDVVRALALLASAAVERQLSCVVNVASGKAVTVRQFCETAADAMQIPRDRLNFGALPLRPDDTLYFAGNPALLTALTGWSPRHSLADGIMETVASRRQAGQ